MEPNGLSDFSDYIVFVDESGDHGLKSIDPEFPVFALAFCIITKSDYTKSVVPAFQGFKFRYWGHDSVVLHENEIRKSKGDFAFLRTDRTLREQFMSELSELMADAPMTIIGSVIDKAELTKKYSNPWNPYEIALHFCLERLCEFLTKKRQENLTTHVIFECRGGEEDRELEVEFHRICGDEHKWGYRNQDFTRIELLPRFAKKSVNSSGLQLADLVARPIALKTIRPNQNNRAYEIIGPKIRTKKVFPS